MNEKLKYTLLTIVISFSVPYLISIPFQNPELILPLGIFNLFVGFCVFYYLENKTSAN